MIKTTIIIPELSFIEAFGALVFAELTLLDVGDVLISNLGGYWENLSFEE